MPETRSGAGASESGDPTQGTSATDAPGDATLAMVLEHIRMLSTEVAELRSDVARVESREESLLRERSEAVTGRQVAELRNEVERAKFTGISLRNELSQVTGKRPAQETSPVSRVLDDGTVEEDSGVKETPAETLDNALSTDYIPVSSAHKLYARELEADRVSRIGDFRFPAARMTWRRLVQDFPVRPEMLRRLVGLGFSGAAKKIYEEVSASNLSAASDELWNLMEAKVYNVSQQRNQRASFYSTSWKEKTESIEQYGARLATAAMTLPEGVSDEALIHRFIDGLPQRLKVQALLIRGGYDEIVATTSLVSKANQRPTQGPELIREVLEVREERPLYRGLPFSERTCFECNKKGHIARMCPNQRKNDASFTGSAGVADKYDQTEQKNKSGALSAQDMVSHK
jgi:Retrotransposon gag protein/Zinc knuckle